MANSLVTIDRQYFNHSIEESVEFTLRAALAKDNHYTLFRYEDWRAWLAFLAVFTVLIIGDNIIMSRSPRTLTIKRAIAYTLFWILCACGFCCGIYKFYGPGGAYMWMSGYMIEWMLSFDNLFVFHLIFTVYATPNNLKHKPLYLGIVGAVVLRLVFIFVGEYLMHAMFFMHLVFGMFLVYTGVKTVVVDDDDDDPSKQPLVQWLQRKVPFVSAYDSQGAFFVRVPVDHVGNPVLPKQAEICRPANPPSETDSIVGHETGAEEDRYGAVDFVADTRSSTHKTQLRATMLFFVLCCIEISDILFAVDSVSAIVAQVNDLFLAYTAAVFAMLGLRATFFIIDVLVRLFSLLKYGVAAVLVFIGVKLLLARFVHIPPGIVCMILVSAIASSMVASVVQDELQKTLDGSILKEIQERTLKLKGKSPSVPGSSPTLKHRDP